MKKKDNQTKKQKKSKLTVKQMQKMGKMEWTIHISNMVNILIESNCKSFGKFFDEYKDSQLKFNEGMIKNKNESLFEEFKK